MGKIFSCCKQKNTRNVPELIKEERQCIFEYSRNGQKKDKDQVGQDVSDIITSEIGQNIKYFAVYDGHGIRGKEAATLAKDEIRKALLNDKKKIVSFTKKDQLEKYFKKLYNDIQNIFLKQKHQEYELSGTCCISCLIINNHCYTINLGDSRAVMGSKGSSAGEKNLRIAYQLSMDLKANNEEEKKRIEEKGGQVTSEKNGPYRIFSKTDDGPGLAVSRTLGDILGHNCGVSSEPVITHKLIDSDDKFIVIASDGVWDVMNSTEVIGYLFEKGENISKEKLPETLVNEARSRWEVINMYKQKLSAEKQKDGRSSTTIHTIDDITCVIYFINSYERNKDEEEEEKKEK